MAAPDPAPRKSVLHVAAVLLVVAAVFAPVLGNGFPMDDEFVAQAHDAAGQPRPMVAELQPVGTYFRSHWWRDYYPGSELYRPVTKLSIALAYHLAGKSLSPEREALPQHAVNLLAHLWATLLVFLILRLVVASRRAALAACLVFGVHALHTEAVAEIVGRCDLFAFCFGAQGLWVFMRATEPARRGPGRAWRLAVAAFLFFLAFCSKEVALAWVPFLPVFVLAERVARGRDTAAPRPALRAALGLAVTLPGLVAFLWLRQTMIASLAEIPAVTFGANPIAHVPVLERVLTAVEVQGYALLKTVFPIRLAADHGPAVFAVVTSPADPGFLAAAVGLGALVLLGLGAARRQPLLLLAVAAFFGFSFVVSNLPFAIGTIFADRLYYLPSAGLAFAAAWFVATLERRDKLPVAAVVLVLWCGHNAVYAFRRSIVFETTSTLAEHDVRVLPSSANLQRLASEAKRERGDYRGAAAHLERAVALDPSFAASWLNLGAALAMLGEDDRAERAYRDGLARSRPDMRAERAGLETNLGLLLWRQGRKGEALVHHRRAVALDPESVRRRGYLLDALSEQGGDAEILAVLREGEKRAPGEAMWSYQRGRRLMRRHRFAAAERELRAAVAKNRRHGEAWIALATTLMSSGQRAEAVRICTGIARDPRAAPNLRKLANTLLARMGGR